MINRQQKFVSSSFVIILLLAGQTLFIIHMISDALELKRKALFLSHCKVLERTREGAQGTIGIAKWRSEAFSFLPSSSTASLSVIQSVPDGRGQSQSSDFFMLLFFFLAASNVWNWKYQCVRFPTKPQCYKQRDFLWKGNEQASLIVSQKVIYSVRL